MQQKLGELYSQVDILEARLHEADENERMIQAKLDTAEHEVCGSWANLFLQKIFVIMALCKSVYYCY